jgi:SAM-dependent methyltransferase
LFKYLARHAGGTPAPPDSKPKGWIGPEEESLIPPRELWVGRDDPIGHYYRWIWEYLAYLTLITRLKREEAVLELGCGHGRTARGLLFYLRTPGRYVGLDVDKSRIDDARERITARWPSFEFVWANVRNAQDNPAGDDAASYRFPFDDSSFDVVYAASLFTHLLPAETLNYFRECRRVLKPNGRCLFSFFILDHYRGRGTTISPHYQFDSPLPFYDGVAVRDPVFPHVAVSYNVATLREFADLSGLRMVEIFPGLWSENPGWAVHEQDLIKFEV